MKKNYFYFTIIIIEVLTLPLSYSQRPSFPKPYNPFKKESKGKEIEKISITRSNTDVQATLGNGSNVRLPLLTYKLTSLVEIVNVKTDTSRSTIFFLSKENGRESALKPVFLHAYNYTNDSIIWKNQFEYQKGVTLFSTPDLCIFRVKRAEQWENLAFHKDNGQMAWRNGYELKSVDLIKGTAFTGLLDCIDLKTGNIKWSRKIENDHGWLGDFRINEKYFTVSDGIHNFDPQNGIGWDYPAKMGKTEHGDLAASIMGNFMAGLAIGVVSGVASGLTGGYTGWYLYPSYSSVYTTTAYSETSDYPKSHAICHSGEYTRTGLVSNIVYEKERLYFSAVDKLCCIDYNTGKKIWERILPDERTGMAFISCIDSNLVFINKGTCYRDRALYPYFTPYFCILDKTSGKILYTRSLNKPFNPVLDYQLTDSSLLILLQNDLYQFDFKGMPLSRLSLSGDSAVRLKTGRFFQFLNDDQLTAIFIRSGIEDNRFVSLSSIKQDGVNQILLTENAIVCFGPGMHVERIIANNDYYVCLYRQQGKCLLAPANELETARYLVDERNNGNLILKLNLTCKSVVDNGYLMLFPTTYSISMLKINEMDKLTQ